MDFSKKKINDVGFYKEKILYLVDNFYDGNKAKFLRAANLSHNYLNSWREKEDPEPSVRAISQMVKAIEKVEPAFNPLWLIADDEPLLRIRGNWEVAAEDDKGNFDIANQENVPYGLINQAFSILNRIEQKVAGSSTDPLPGDVELVLSRLLNTSLERRHKDQNAG